MAGRGGPYITVAKDTALAASTAITATLYVNGDYVLRRVEIVIDGASDATSRDVTVQVVAGPQLQAITPVMNLDEFLPINLLEATGSAVDSGISQFNAGAFLFAGWRTLAIPFRDQCQIKLINGAGATTNVMIYMEATPRDRSE